MKNTDEENEDQAEGRIKQRSQIIDLSKEQEKKEKENKFWRTKLQERITKNGRKIGKLIGKWQRCKRKEESRAWKKKIARREKK